MGIFDIFKSNKESDEKNDPERIRNLVLLSRLGINPYDLSHDEMESTEISLTEELEGAIRISDLTYLNGENEFNYISLTDKKDDQKSLFKSINDPDERKVRELVDNCADVLGNDFVDQNEFTTEDLINYRDLFDGHLRTWYPFNFEVIIGFTTNEIGKTIYLMVNER